MVNRLLGEVEEEEGHPRPSETRAEREGGGRKRGWVGAEVVQRGPHAQPLTALGGAATSSLDGDTTALTEASKTSPPSPPATPSPLEEPLEGEAGLTKLVICCAPRSWSSPGMAAEAPRPRWKLFRSGSARAP